MKRAWAAVAVGIAILVALWLRADRDDATAPADAGVRATTTAPRGPRPAALAVTGRVTSKLDGTGVAGTTVAFRSLAHPGLSPQAIVAIADANGGWTASVAPGNYAVSTSADGFLPRFSEEAVAAGTRLDLVLEPGGSLLSGTVTDLGGGPVADAQVVAYVRNDTVIAVSRVDGRYRMTLPDGSYAAIARHEAYTPELCEAFLGTSPATCDFALVPGGTIRGQVVADETGQPVGDAVVTAMGVGHHMTIASAVSDPDGTFALDEIGPGAIRLTASARGFTSGVPTIVDHAMGEHAERVRVSVQRTFVVSGRVEDHGVGVSGVWVGAVSKDHPAHRIGSREPTDPTGAFTIVGLHPGSYEITGSLDARTTALIPFAILDRDVSGLVAPLGPPAAATGFDVGGHIEAPGVATVELDIETTTTDASGAFVFHNVEAGKHELRASTRDDRVGLVALAITSARTDLVVRIGAGATASGKVIDDTGHPVAGVRVAASNPARRTPPHPVMSGTDGSFRVERIAPGKVHLEALLDNNVFDDQATALDLVLAEGETRPGITIVVPSRFGTIHGQVVDAAGIPVAEAWVQGTNVYEPRLPAVPTKSDGSFVFEHLRKGTQYHLDAESPRGDARGRARASANDRVVIKLAPLGAIAVRVTQDGAPVRSYDLDCATMFDSHLHVSSPDGTYVLDHLVAGHHHCAATTVDGTAAGDVEVAGGIAHLELQIPRATLVTGTLVDALTGMPLAGIRVVAIEGGRSGVASDASGAFALSHVPTSGTLWFRPQNDYDALGSVPFRVGDGGQADLGTLRIAPTAGNGGDLGFWLGTEDGRVGFIAVDGPAARAGLKVGDELLTIDGAPVAGMARGAVSAILNRGVAVGRTVQLGLARGVTIAVTAVLP